MFLDIFYHIKNNNRTQFYLTQMQKSLGSGGKYRVDRVTGTRHFVLFRLSLKRKTTFIYALS